MELVLNKKVPDFTATATNETKIKLSQLKGKKVVIYFYPRDNTPGCTTEGLDFRKHFKEFTKLNTVIIGVSRDSLASHEKFKEKCDFPFDLISDETEKLCRQFAVIKMKNLYGKLSEGIERSTFLIDENGVLKHMWRKVKVPEHVAAVLTAIKNLP